MRLPPSCDPYLAEIEIIDITNTVPQSLMALWLGKELALFLSSMCWFGEV
jgi:hypothetical protein